MAEPRQIELARGELGALPVELANLRAAGAGWVNLDPAVEELPPVSPLGGIFSAKGPAAPHATWVAPRARRRRSEPETIGLQHGLGRPALETLRHDGIQPHDGWRRLADSPRRGLVLAVRGDEDPATLLEWLLRAGEAVTTVPLTGTWRASLHTG